MSSIDELTQHESELSSAALNGASLALVRRQGRPKAGDEFQPTFEILRELTAADFATLNEKTISTLPKGGRLERLKAKHHHLAQLLASGATLEEASRVTGYEVAWISNLKSNPAFKGLLAHYQGIDEVAFVDARQRLEALGLAAIEELQERIDERPEDFNTQELQSIAEMGVLRPHLAALKATGAVVAAQVPRSFQVVFRSANGDQGQGQGQLIEGEKVG